MLVADGAEQVRAFTETAYPPTVTEFVPGVVYHVMGYGHSNAGFIIADTSVILIDALDTDTRGARLAGIIAEHTDKPVKTIIDTHGHPDHRGGAGAFAATNAEVVAIALKNAKATAFLGLLRQEMSANGRHYYLACARELLAGEPA